MLPKALRITIIVLALLVTVALIAAVVTWQTRQAAVAKRLESIIQEFVIANDSTRIEISSVSGNPLSSLTLRVIRWESWEPKSRTSIPLILSFCRSYLNPLRYMNFGSIPTRSSVNQSANARSIAP